MANNYANQLEFNVILDNLASYAYTEYAKDKIKNLHPLMIQKDLIAAMETTNEARKIIDVSGNPPSVNLDNIRNYLETAEKGGALTPEQLDNTGRFIVSCRRLKAYMRKSEASGTEISSYGAAIDTLDFLYGEISRSIINGVIDNGASPELYDIRRNINMINNQIKTKLESLLHVNRDICSDGFISIRNGHFTIPVKREYKSRVPGSVIDISSAGSTCFIEPSSIARLTDQLSLLESEENREEEKILYALTGIIYDYSAEIRINAETAETLDFIFAKGRLSVSLNGISPKINTDRRISITKGRHPLLNPSSCVPLDFEIGGEIRGVVITGPNTGGKTVSLKLVGLFSMMAQSGLHIPCESADICMSSSVLCDIGDGQSISENLSTFSSHITSIINILKTADPESLVLLDELGSGTDPAEGMGIAISILDELRKRRCLFVATTHYPEVKDYAKNSEGLINARMTFDRETLKPLYSLVIGESGDSCALYIAKQLGFPPHMLRRAYSEAYEKQNTGHTETTGDILSGLISEDMPQILPETSVSKHVSGSAIKPLKDTEKLPLSAHAAGFSVGDSVIVYPQKILGIICRTSNPKGELVVQIRDKKQLVNHKRIRLKTPAGELYPEDYDFSIIFDTVANRKARHKMDKGHQPGLVIDYGSDNIH